jgi:hypothetical protein
MEQFKDTVFKLKKKKYIKDVVITLIFLTVMVSSFYFSVVGGAPNLIFFIIMVIFCFTIITLFLARHIYIGLVMMVYGGMFGFFTDFWGTGNNVFQYVPGTNTFIVLLSGELGNGGVPFEIVASYFFASMWLTQIIESLFDKEIEELIDEYDNGIKLIKSYKQMLPVIIVIIISVIMVSINPVLIQPWTYFSIGVFLTCLVPGTKKIIPILFGITVGLAGLFFELFCSGEIFPNVIVWTYNEPDWSFEHTYRAIIAYAGGGAGLASIFLILLRIPLFRREITIISIRKRE